MRNTWPVAVIAAGTLLLTACASEQPAADGVASLSSAQTTPGEAPAANTGTDEDKMREFAKCMREQGIDLPDPKPAPGGGQGGVMIEVNGDGPESAKIKAANEKCRPLLPNGGKPPKLSPEDLDKMREHAKCLREHGLDVPDPDPENPGVMIGDPSKMPDPETEKKAFEACGGEVHRESK